MCKNLIHKIKRKLAKLRMKPIHVYCLHHVSESIDREWMNENDWMQIDEFKNRILMMQQNGVRFISLKEVHHHLSSDKIRFEQYAVLTFDDGWASLREVLPWLEEQCIPVTLFISGKYIDGKSYRRNPKEQYLTTKEVFQITSNFVEIGFHGWDHIRASEMSISDFEASIKNNLSLLGSHPNLVPFWAYPYGAHKIEEDQLLKNQGFVPVLMDGVGNLNNPNVIHREQL